MFRQARRKALTTISPRVSLRMPLASARLVASGQLTGEQCGGGYRPGCLADNRTSRRGSPAFPIRLLPGLFDAGGPESMPDIGGGDWQHVKLAVLVWIPQARWTPGGFGATELLGKVVEAQVVRREARMGRKPTSEWVQAVL
jgi:hypothetical protein